MRCLLCVDRSMSDNVRVLVVDDEDLVRGGIVAILESDGTVAVVGQAASGPEGVERALDLVPDIVLMDIQMPGGDGLVATREILSRCPATKVIVLTTFDLDEYVYQALRAGASGFLLKTTAPAQLARAVHACHAGEALFSPSITRRLVENYVRRQPTTAPRDVGLLTAREIEVLREIASGKSNAEIATALFLGQATVKTHVTHILTKLDLRDRVQMVVFAYEHGLVDAARPEGRPRPKSRS